MSGSVRSLAPEPAAGLHIEALSFAYGTRAVLSGVTAAPLVPGSLTALIGPNASGKSTLFRLIAGLLKPASGTVRLGGEDLAHRSVRQRLKRVCFMPQFFATNAALTVFDVVAMAHKQLEGWRITDEDMTAVGHALHDAGSGHLADAYVGELSGGQSQMVSVAQANVRRCEVYLFDEPTSALDLKHQLDVLSRIGSAMRARGAIGIIALHDLTLAARFAEYALLLGGGTIRAEGPVHAVLRDPEISAVYGVEIELTNGPREEIIVHAYAH